MHDRRLLLRDLGSLGDLPGPHSVLVADGTIVALDAAADAASAGAEVLDGGGLTAVPGFIELQVNGVAGHDFTSDPRTMWTAGEELARYGVTSFLPTIVTAPAGVAEGALQTFANGGRARGAVPLGIHLEGPFLSPVRAGAHDPASLRHPDLGVIEAWIATGATRIVTLAPELPGADAAIARLVAAGVVVSIGHTDADAATTSSAIDAGARFATHLFNAMPPMLHRAPGAAGALLADDRVTVGIILDGHHLDPIVAALIARTASGRVALVSDAIAGLGLPDGRHRLGDADVLVAGGAARRQDGTLAGSVVGLDACVRALAELTGSVRTAVEAVTATPARLLGLEDGRGRIAVGGRADLVLLDADLRVQHTIVGGKPAWSAGSAA